MVGVGVVLSANCSGTGAEDLAERDGEQLVVRGQAPGSRNPGIAAGAVGGRLAEVGDQERGRIGGGAGAPGSGVVVERSADLLGRRPMGGALQAAIAGSELAGLPLGLVVQILEALLQAGSVPREPTGVVPRLVDGAT